jgi:long-chain acyl-CoA synthetase
MDDAVRSGEDVVVTALPLYHIFALMVNFISYYSIGAENWLIALTGVNTLYGALVMHLKISKVDFSRLRVRRRRRSSTAVIPATASRHGEHHVLVLCPSSATS